MKNTEKCNLGLEREGINFFPYFPFSYNNNNPLTILYVLLANAKLIPTGNIYLRYEKWRHGNLIHKVGSKGISVPKKITPLVM